MQPTQEMPLLRDRILAAIEVKPDTNRFALVTQLSDANPDDVTLCLRDLRIEGAVTWDVAFRYRITAPPEPTQQTRLKPIVPAPAAPLEEWLPGSAPAQSRPQYVPSAFIRPLSKERLMARR